LSSSSVSQPRALKWPSFTRPGTIVRSRSFIAEDNAVTDTVTALQFLSSLRTGGPCQPLKRMELTGPMSREFRSVTSWLIVTESPVQSSPDQTFADPEI
jgi:hypothetical protein